MLGQTSEQNEGHSHALCGLICAFIRFRHKIDWKLAEN